MLSNLVSYILGIMWLIVSDIQRLCVYLRHMATRQCAVYFLEYVVRLVMCVCPVRCTIVVVCNLVQVA